MLPVEISIVIKMEQLKFETSMKNIPLGGNKEYVMQLTQSVRKVVYAMSWAAFIFLNNIQCEEKETYGFRSQKPMPNVEELKDFKDACVDLIGGIKWRRNASNPLQRKLLLNGIRIDYVFTTICYESSTNFLPLFCYDSSTKKVTMFPLNGNKSSTILQYFTTN